MSGPTEKRIRVLVCDDAVVVRRIVTDVLGGDPGIEVVGTAANGRIGLAKIEQLKPDLVTLDVEMPEMDGLTALREIRKLHPRLPVIMFSTLTARGASTTLDALAAGASDYVTKPANVGSVAVAMQRIREELIPKIKSLCARAEAAPAAAPVRPAVAAKAATSVPPRPRPANAGYDVVAIAVSTGGPNALSEVIPALPADLSVPVVITQHMPPVFTRVLAERLDAKSALRVHEAAGGETLQAGHVYLAPGDHHLVVERGANGAVTTRLDQGPPENSCRPAADVMMRSVVRAYGANVLGVVLTGMGADGLVGCRAIRDAGGAVIVQDQATSVVWGMPGIVARNGLAEQQLPLNAVADAIAARVKSSRRTAA